MSRKTPATLSVSLTLEFSISLSRVVSVYSILLNVVPVNFDLQPNVAMRWSKNSTCSVRNFGTMLNQLSAKQKTGCQFAGRLERVRPNRERRCREQTGKIADERHYRMEILGRSHEMPFPQRHHVL